jgi:hypothetical protein
VGYRPNTNGKIVDADANCGTWSSSPGTYVTTVPSSVAGYTNLSKRIDTLSSLYRAAGMAVRCARDR